jgi:hypothetical protein
MAKTFVLMDNGHGGHDTFLGVFDSREKAMVAADKLPRSSQPFLMETEFNTAIPHWQREKDWLKV